MADQLTTPTNRTVTGPKLTMEARRLVVDYDYENDDGSLRFGRIVFEDLLAFQFWDSCCIPAENVLSPTELRVLSQSDYLNNVTDAWFQTVGWYEVKRNPSAISRFRHYTVYFDDAGSVDVIAATCHVDA